MRKILFFILMMVYLTGFAGAEPAGEKRLQLSILAGIDRVSGYGSEDDYIAGENDFPVMPSHRPTCLGISVAYSLTKQAVIELASRYYFSSTVTLEDPSDEDTVEVNTAKHFSLTANFIYRLSGKTFSPYLAAGGGIDNLLAKDETYTSAYGYEIEFLVPEKKADLVLNLGGGIQYSFSSHFGLVMDVRYVVIFDKPSNVNSLNLMAGVFMKF
ncbi:MAG: outer membrane beta-barrel protein [Candidatus Aminicenantes bacterium]|nr:MAG: outer membrane beta-barrel protein [Candidatus Aminicenantes bacterium]